MLTKHRDFHGNTEWRLQLSDHQMMTMSPASFWMLKTGLRLISAAMRVADRRFAVHIHPSTAAPSDTRREREPE